MKKSSIEVRLTHAEQMATSKTRTQTLDPDPEKPGPRKIWILKNMDPGKHGINMGLKNMSDFRELLFYKDHELCDLLFKNSQISHKKQNLRCYSSNI